MRAVFLSALFWPALAGASAPGFDTYQMQRLIQNSEKQLEAREMVKQCQADSANQERALEILQKLSKGIEQQIKL